MQKMREEIALYCLKADSESYSEVCEECSIYGNVGCDHCYNDAINTAIQALEEIQQYRAIGTLDQCREAVERMKPKKPIEYEDKYYGCPKCGNALMHKWEKYPTILKPKSKGLPCCWNCLQVIDWSE